MRKVPIQAITLGLVGCPCCGLVSCWAGAGSHCPRCGNALHQRLPNSLMRTWALLLTAVMLYIPANTLPVMSTRHLGQTLSATLLGGVALFIEHGDWPLALVIFVASVLVPLLKVLSLSYLLISVHRHSTLRAQERARLYRVTELMGRWSMVDVFVVAVLTALVQMGNLAAIFPGPGASAFAGVVILTMLAAQTFDPRLIWDAQRSLDEQSTDD